MKFILNTGNPEYL